MRGHVEAQVGRVVEGLVAYVALVRLVAGMDEDMCPQVSLHTEQFFAEWALIASYEGQ